MAVNFVTDLPDLGGGAQYCPGSSRPILQSLLSNITVGFAHSHGNCHSTISPSLPHIWSPRRHHVGPWATVYFESLEGVLCFPGDQPENSKGGVSSSRGLSTPKTRSPIPLWNSLPSSVCWVISHPCYHGQANHLTCQLWMIGLGAARRSGNLPMSGCNGPFVDRGSSPCFTGPFRIVRQLNPVTYCLQLLPSYRISPTYQVSLLKPAHPRHNDPSKTDEPPPLIDINGAPAYRVSSLLNSQRHRNRLQYLVDWEGYSPEEHSWTWRKRMTVPREELWYCMRKSGVAEKYVRVVQDMYERSRTVVRCAVGQTEEFKVEVGLHQGSALSPFLFAIVMDQLSEEVRQESPWTMMFADDIVICSESREQVEENQERWRFALERRGMKVSRSKTEYMCVNEREGSETVRLQGEEVKKVQEFKYLGSTVQSNGECVKEVKKRVQAGWNGWRKVSGVLCDRKISARIKGKVYRTVVRLAMLYGLETVSLRKRQESELEVAELKMLRFSLGVTRLDRIRNEYIRGTAHVGRLGDKVREARLRWFGHVQRRESEYIGRRMLDMELPGRRQRGKPKRRYMEVTNEDMKLVGASVEDAEDRDSPAHGSGCYHHRRTTTGYFTSYGSSGATGDYRSARSADPLLSRSGGGATEPTPQHESPHGTRQQRASLGLGLRSVGRGPSDLYVVHILRGNDMGAQSRWNDAVLWAVFREGLSPTLQTELACREDATSLTQYVATTIRLDKLLHQHRAGARPPVSSHPRLHLDYPRPREEVPKPMQLGRSRLTEREHQRWAQMRLCYYCRGSGHLIQWCPERPSSAQVGENSLFFSFTVPVSLYFSDRCVPVSTLIDSRATVNLIDRALVEELRIPTIPCMPSLRITAIDSQPIGGGYLTHQTELLEFQVGLFHWEHLAFYVTSSPANPVILGFPWLRQHDPQISWHMGELVRWSATCLSKCLHKPVSRPCLASVVEDSAPLASRHVPRVYGDFLEVFSKERGTRLPLHRAWDCAIDLLPNTSPPRGRVYPLSLPEARAMEAYIEEALAVGHIWPSTSPAAAGFFFVGKKDGGLCPCIDYRGLNVITVRYPYPLPLVPAALEQLRGAKFFTKLDLRSAYNLVRIWEGDEWKTAFHTTHGHYEYVVMPFGLTNAPALFQSFINEVFQDILGKLQQNHLYVKQEKCEFHRTTITFLGYVISRQGVEMDLTKVQVVTEWPNSTTVKELQRFLGFANFYRRFIRNYSSMAGPLTSLL
ncbi:hypothetical protein QTP86_014422 [Hemibagrus guttatus]|nr:hypothetical protein QTP86_014422 [Hemibagrus guttatus]